jgi:hypothetical protein
MNINFLTPASCPGGVVTIAGGGFGQTILHADPSFNLSPGQRVFIKRIEATCTVAGTPGVFTLTDDVGTVLALLAFANSSPGTATLPPTRIIYDFPVPFGTPLVSGGFILNPDALGTGTWKINAYGFIA